MYSVDELKRPSLPLLPEQKGGKKKKKEREVGGGWGGGVITAPTDLSLRPSVSLFY